jgi:hypothetical protein
MKHKLWVPETRESKSTADRVRRIRDEPRACFCIGPQDGDPVCPCRMRYLVVENGRYVEKIDRGPAKPDDRIAKAVKKAIAES